jgi:hypothetical protein
MGDQVMDEEVVCPVDLLPERLDRGIAHRVRGGSEPLDVREQLPVLVS